MDKEINLENIEQAALYWVGEACGAISDIAFIRAFDEVRQNYVDIKQKEKHTLSPIYNPFGRVAIHRLYATSDSLALFCIRAVDSTGGSCSLKQFKNLLVRCPASPLEKECAKKLGLDMLGTGDDWESVKLFRNKFVAHIDKVSLFAPAEQTVKVSCLIKCAEQVIAPIRTLVDKSGVKPVGTLEKPVRSRAELVIPTEECARQDARTFWEDNFSKWAK